MKKILFTIALFCATFSFSYAQESQILVIENQNHGAKINYEHAKRLSERLKSAFTAASLSEQTISIFAIRPYMEVTEFGKVEGVKTKVTCNASLRLSLQNLLTGANFSEQTISFQGIGDDKNAAINQAINSIKASNAGLKKFATQTQTDIAAYYTKECANVLTQAQQQLELKNFVQAAIVSGAVPTSATCYKDAQTLKQKSLLAFQENNCKNLLTKSDAFTAANDFKSALMMLSQIDASSACANDVKSRIAAIEGKVDEKNKEEFDWFFKAYATGAELQKAQNKIYEEILLNFFRETKGVRVY